MILFGNLIPIYYQNSGTGKLIPILDEDGFDTGEVQEVRPDVELAFCTVSPAETQAEEMPFGTFTDYDRVMLMSQRQFFDSGITEQTHVWVAPRLKAIQLYNFGERTVNPKHHKKYIVRRVAEGVQWVRLALSEISE